MNTHLKCNDIVTFSTLHMLSRYNDYIGISDKIEERNYIKTSDETSTPQQKMFIPATQYGMAYSSPALSFTAPGINLKRPRGEKKPIPENMKDDRYFERRKRNNQAAKKSRDARRMREDQIAFRATILEQENAVLRAQILTLREEAHSLRQLLLLQRKTSSYMSFPTSSN